MIVASVMKQASRFRWIGNLVLLGGLLLGLSWSGAMAQGTLTPASSEGPAQRVYAPPQAPAPAMLVISGQGGMTDDYQAYARKLAALGYFTVLVDGNDILPKGAGGFDSLKKAMARAQQSPQVVKGKTGVVSFSLGGGAGLAWAANLPDQVSMVIAYYPFTSFDTAKDANAFVKRFRVPVLTLAAERDNYKNCCLIETIRAIETVAKQSGANFELVVYSRANHGFNLNGGSTYRHEDDQDSWKRTQDFLRRYHPSKVG